MLQFFSRENMLCISDAGVFSATNIAETAKLERDSYRIEDNMIFLRVVLLTGTSISRSKQGIIVRGTVPTWPDLFYN